MPPTDVQRKASVPLADALKPTTVDPSSDMPKATLSKMPPVRSPSGSNKAC